jgi:glycosyltransferase involved in cell wall biosynthesis
MKTVLLVAPYFIPRRRVGALRPFKFAIHLKKFGYQPVILTIGNPGSELTVKEKDLLQEIPIIEIYSPFDRTGPTISNPANAGKKNRFSGFVMDWIDKQTPLDTWIFLFKAKYNSILSKVKKYDPEIIWATGDPWSGLWLGEKIAADLKKPFIADFRDPWTLSKISLRARSDFSSALDKHVEKRIITSADRIVFTSEMTRHKYSQYYPEISNKTDTIYNSYDKNLVRPKPDKKWNFKPDPKKLNIIFFGRFRRLSPAKPVTDALKRIKSTYPEALKYIRIHSFGIPDTMCQDHINQAGLNHNFVFHEPVVPEEMTPVLKCADILLLSTNVDRDDIIPAKLWDYLAVEVPILSIVSNPEVNEIIMRSKAGIQVHPKDIAEIAEILTSFSMSKKNNDLNMLTVEKDIPKRDIYESENTTCTLAAIFDDLTANA